MNDKVLKTLEYNKITDKLESFAATEMARLMCRNLKPMTDIDLINSELARTNDALARSIAHHAPSFGGFRDFLECSRRLEVGSSLNLTELLNVSSLLAAAARAKAYGGHREEPDSLSPFFLSSFAILICLLHNNELMFVL